MPDSTEFARLVALACHDLRTPLATVHGFTKTLMRMEQFGEPVATYLGMMDTAAGQLGELLDDLGVAARIEAERYEPALQDTDTLELAARAAELLEPGQLDVAGAGATVRVDPEPTVRALKGLARCAIRHGGLQKVALGVDGAALTLSPVTAEAAPVVMAEELRDLGAAVAARVIEAQGGSLALEGEQLRVQLPG